MSAKGEEMGTIVRGLIVLFFGLSKGDYQGNRNARSAYTHQKTIFRLDPRGLGSERRDRPLLYRRS